MFREMRRKQQQLSCEATKELLLNGKTGTLALCSDGGYPYSLPVNYYFDGDDKIYFHCAKQGHKIDAIKHNPKVSMSVIANDEVLQEKFTTLYISAIIFGRAKIIDNPENVKFHGAKLAEKICPQNIEKISDEISKGAGNMIIVEITIDHMTGKECIEFTKKRKSTP